MNYELRKKSAVCAALGLLAMGLLAMGLPAMAAPQYAGALSMSWAVLPLSSPT